MAEETKLGKIMISPLAVASIVYHAALQSYGVVGLAPRTLVEGLSLGRESSRGVAVHYDGENIDIDIHIVVAYGTRITSVAASVANTVRFQIEKTLGLRVNVINVHIAGLKNSEETD